MRLLHSQGGGVDTTGLDPPAGPTGCETLILVFKSRHEKLLDDTEALLYCDHQSIATLSSLYHKPLQPAVTRID